MLKLTLANLNSHRRRVVATSLSIVLGVAFMTGTLLLGDTMNGGFEQIYGTLNRGSDVIIRSADVVGTDDAEQRGGLDPSVVDTVRSVDGVRDAVANYVGIGQLVGSDGVPLGGDGPPTFASGWLADAEINPFVLDRGRSPEGPGEIVIDQQSATNGALDVDSRTAVLTPERQEVTVVGIASLPNSESVGGATWAWFSQDEAARILENNGLVSSILVSADPGRTATEVRTSISAALPSGVEALTSDELTAEQLDAINADFLGFLRAFLVAFSVIAMLVAAFSIHNTFAMLLAQRTRESALLRALGSTRRQVLSSVLAETTIIGVTASIVGAAAGVGLAAGLLALMRSGMDIPVGGLVVGADRLFLSAGVGLVATLLAAMMPAIAASRVAPLAALRATATEQVTVPRRRVVMGLAFAAVSAILLVVPATREWDRAALWVGVGALLAVVSLVVLGPVVAGPVVSLLGRPVASLRGVGGQLARRNAVRSPRRTAATASALTVGVAVVTVFMVFGSSITTSIEDTVARSVRADLMIGTDNFSGAGLTPSLQNEIAQVPGVDAAVNFGTGASEIDGSDMGVTVADPGTIEKVLDLDVESGELATMTTDEIAIDDQLAKDRGWTVGSVVDVRFAAADAQPTRVAVIYTADDTVGDVVVAPSLWARAGTPAPVLNLLVKLDPSADTIAVRAEIDGLARAESAPASITRSEYIDQQAGQVDDFLKVVYALLGLSVLIALMGIANTLSLAVHERVRELGLLRAVGTTRAQTRSMVRWESVLISVFGTTAGIGLGVLCGWALVRAIATDADLGVFSAPIGSLAMIAAIGAVAGVVASLRPAGRAAKLNVLDAIGSG